MVRTESRAVLRRRATATRQRNDGTLPLIACITGVIAVTLSVVCVLKAGTAVLDPTARLPVLAIGAAAVAVIGGLGVGSAIADRRRHR